MNEEEKKALEILETEGTENHYLEVQIVLYLVNKLQKEIIERDMLLDMYQNNYISKDKIRKKIKEIDEEGTTQYWDSEIIKFLNELLEE